MGQIDDDIQNYGLDEREDDEPRYERKQMAQLRIEEVLPSKSGKAWRVKSGGKWYNAFGDSGIEAHTGKLIEAEITTHEKFGPGIQKYKVIEAQSAPTQAAETIPARFAIPNAGTNTAPYWQTFVSNQVASAIQAGLIKEPSDLKEWTFAAMNAIKGAVEGDVSF